VIDLLAVCYLIPLYNAASIWPEEAYILTAILLFSVSAIHHWLPRSVFVHRLDQVGIWNYVVIQALGFSTIPELIVIGLFPLMIAGVVIKGVFDPPDRTSNQLFLGLGVALFCYLLVEAAVVDTSYPPSVWVLFLAGCICYLLQLYLYVQEDVAGICRDCQHLVLVAGCYLHTIALGMIHS
jgi:predicted membrane channel-forming protein YqfA (hemolysin III family)